MPGSNGEAAGCGVLAPETLALMFTPVVQLQGQGAWGLGHQISTLADGSEAIGHAGANAGWRAYFGAIPEQSVGIVVLTNSDNGMALIEDVVSATRDLPGIGAPWRVRIFNLSDSRHAMSPGCLTGRRAGKWVPLVNRGSSQPFGAFSQTI
jgi:CubicO group peptidase (beta-lactamase class C family)